MRRATWPCGLLLVGALVGCHAGSGPAEPDPNVLRSTQRHDQRPKVSKADQAALREGNTAFAFALYDQLRSREGNLICSPYSLSTALAMVFAGARGVTEQEMAQALCFTLPQERLHPAFNRLQLDLTGEQHEDSGFQLRTANGLWVQQGEPIQESYLDTLAANYDAGLRLADFRGHPGAARKQINAWVSKQTAKKIPHLLEPVDLNADVSLVLANAIYFIGAWAHEFWETATTDDEFHRPDGSTVSCQMMHATRPALFTRGDGWQAVRLPYYGHRQEFIGVLPDEGRFGATEAAFDTAALDSITTNEETTSILLGLPKFGFETRLGLADTLTQVGLPTAFANADFSGIREGDLNLSDVIQEACIDVDERGTEAAAATAVVMAAAADMAAHHPLVVTFDHPFWFCIRDIPTGALLFIGRVVDPTA